MPACVIPPEPGISFHQYGIVGSYAALPGSRFVCHVALTRAEGESVLTHGEDVRVWHMGPPLVADVASLGRSNTDPMHPAHVIGWLNLLPDEREGITDWLAEVGKEDRPFGLLTKWASYTVSLDPEDQWKHDEKGSRQYRRFNCASFVLMAYLEGAGVSLLDTSGPASLPEVGWDIIGVQYGAQAQRLAGRRAEIGFPGNGPWRVVCGVWYWQVT
jgi:hypothetical protein